MDNIYDGYPTAIAQLVEAAYAIAIRRHDVSIDFVFDALDLYEEGKFDANTPVEKVTKMVLKYM